MQSTVFSYCTVASKKKYPQQKQLSLLCERHSNIDQKFLLITIFSKKSSYEWKLSKSPPHKHCRKKLFYDTSNLLHKLHGVSTQFFILWRTPMTNYWPLGLRNDLMLQFLKSVFMIRTPNQLQVAKIMPCNKLVSNIEKSYQILNFSLF